MSQMTAARTGSRMNVGISQCNQLSPGIYRAFEKLLLHARLFSTMEAAHPNHHRPSSLERDQRGDGAGKDYQEKKINMYGIESSSASERAMSKIEPHC